MPELDSQQTEKAMTLEIRTPLGWKDGQVWSWCLCQGHSISGAWHLFCNSSSSCDLLWPFKVQVELAPLRKCFWTEVDRLAHWFGWSLIFLPFGDWNDQGGGVLWLSCGNTLAWLLISFFSTARILSQDHSPPVVYVSWDSVCSSRYHVHHGKGKWLLN